MIAALASRECVAAFFSHAEARLGELEAVIDEGYRRLRRCKTAGWESIEALEVEREEIILRMDEACAMMEYQQDACDDSDANTYAAVDEPSLNPRPPLPHGWEWPDDFDRELTPQERRAQGRPEPTRN